MQSFFFRRACAASASTLQVGADHAAARMRGMNRYKEPHCCMRVSL
jgi:hypothetical protein